MSPKKTTKKTAGRQRHLPSQRNAIWQSAEWITKGLDFCKLHGSWREWEDRLLTELSHNPGSDCDSAMHYSLDVLKRPWPALETVLVGRILGPDARRASLLAVLNLIRYTHRHNGSETLEGTILKQGSPAAAFVYSVYGTRRRWQIAEPLILSGDTPTRTAIGYGPGQFHDTGTWVKEAQVVSYARLFQENGWPELEDKLKRGECHPQVAYEYARKVLQGPLPSTIHNWLMIDSFDAAGDHFRQRYVEFLAAKRSQPS